MSEEDIDFLISIQDLEQPEFDNACLERENKKLQHENKQLKELKYKFFDIDGDEESFTLEDYLEISNKLYDYKQENKQLKEQLEYLRSNEYLNQVKWERNFNEELVKDLQTKIDKAIELIKYTIQHYEELRKKPFADSVFQSDMLRQSFITTIQSFLELLLEDLGDKE